MEQDKYLDEALQIEPRKISPLPKSVGWQAPSNIALVKYWGKKAEQKPLNPSLSMTLSHLSTHTKIHYTRARHSQGQMWFRFDGEENQAFAERIRNYMANLRIYFPFLDQLDLHMDSYNNFPHSAGMASSASSMSALALSICSIEQRLKEEHLSPEAFFRKASFMARLGSGSASRSVYGNFVRWGQDNSGVDEKDNSGSDEYAQPLPAPVDDNLAFLHDTVLITSSQPKKISSSQGHQLMQDHPYQQARIQQAADHIEKITRALKEGHFQDFSQVAEQEALSLHALMLSSNPGYLLLNESSLRMIDELRAFRASSGTSITFTLDAGPNVHIIYPIHEKERVRSWLDQKIDPMFENARMIHDFTGKGPERLDL